MTQTFEGWDSKRWARTQQALRGLEVDELLKLACSGGIEFADTDDIGAEEIICVLDELSPAVLLPAIDRLKSQRTSKGG